MLVGLFCIVTWFWCGWRYALAMVAGGALEHLAGEEAIDDFVAELEAALVAGTAWANRPEAA